MAETENPAVHLSADEIRQAVGVIDDQRLAKIEALLPTLAEGEAAVAWIGCNDEAMHKERREISGKIGTIFELLEANPEPDR